MENRKNLNPIEYKLIDSLHNNNLSKSLEIIHSDVDINSLIEFQFEDNKPVFQSLLHIMIVLRNVNSLQFLLEQGANPNILNVKGQSTLEILLTELCVKVVNYVYNKGSALTKIDIIQYEKMVDLLLCFELNYHNITWTKSFLEYTNHLKNDVEIVANERLKNCKLITTINTLAEMPDYKKKSWVIEKFGSFIRKVDTRLLEKENKMNEIHDEDLESWVHSTSNIVKLLGVSSTKIQSEKKEMFVAISKNIEECISPTLSVPFISIILEYANTMLDVSIRVAKMRVAQGAATHFWLKIPRDPFDSELYKNILIYAATIKNILPALGETSCRPDTCARSFDGLPELIAEYALDNTTQGIKKISSKASI